ncbi:MAG: VOC family protein [Alphaproteobacteria bacterium]|nr:VOC family protein [Alphaproteobacteria bacterium]
MADIAIPTLPMRDLAKTIAFYKALGFKVVHVHDGELPYVILARGAVELHFFGMPDLDPESSYGGCYVRADDIDTWFKSFEEAAVGTLHPIDQKPWGLREFALIDLDGNLIRVGGAAPSAKVAASERTAEPKAVKQPETVVVSAPKKAPAAPQPIKIKRPKAPETSPDEYILTDQLPD